MGIMRNRIMRGNLKLSTSVRALNYPLEIGAYKLGRPQTPACGRSRFSTQQYPHR